MLKAVFFDLDGTLLPMDQEAFTKGYFKLLAAKMAPHGYEPEKLVEAIWKGTAAMVKNDGQQTNETVFWKVFSDKLGERVLEEKTLLEDFYREEFQQAKAFCGYNPKAAEAVHKIKEMGMRVALATNPIFPPVATESRMRWAGLRPDDFEFYTTYDNSSSCKPNPAYYEEVLQKMAIKPQECLMVGNDVKEDMVAESLGMQVFLLTDCLINSEEKDISGYAQGSFPELLQFVEEIG